MSSSITFRQVSADEARIYDADGDYVGDVFRQPTSSTRAGMSMSCTWHRGPARLGPGPRARTHPRGRRGAPPLPSPLAMMPARKTETGAVRGEREVPSRRDVRGCHTCSQQQPCGSSGRSAPCGLAQDALSRAVNVADREAGLARTLRHRVCGTPAPRAGPACRPGAPKPPGTRQPAPNVLPGCSTVHRSSRPCRGGCCPPRASNAYW